MFDTPETHEFVGQWQLTCSVFSHPLGVEAATAFQCDVPMIRAYEPYVITGNLPAAIDEGIGDVLVDLLTQ